jgi:hypothetical protein
MSGAEDIRERNHRALLKVRLDLSEDRSVVEFRDGAVCWTLFASCRQSTPDQGWKIHIASSIGDAPRLFAKVVPAMLARNCAFKIPASINDAVTINSGRAGRTLIGKIVTVYPADDGEVPGLAAGLDRLWQFGRGARNPDRPSPAARQRHLHSLWRIQIGRGRCGRAQAFSSRRAPPRRHTCAR